MAKYERYNNEQAYQTLLFDTKLTHPPPGEISSYDIYDHPMHISSLGPS
jgi:hypothetical protein